MLNAGSATKLTGRMVLCRKRKGRKKMLPASFLGAYLGFILWVASFKYMTANIAGLISQLSTFVVVTLAVLVLHERLTRWKAIALVLASIGTILVFL